MRDRKARSLGDVILAATSSPEDTQALAVALSEVFAVGDLIVLAGDLGAGKTCFTQGLGAGLGITERMTSPTFTLINRYDKGRIELNHLDVYRLDDIAETLDLDLPELLEVGLTVIEWGEEITEVLPIDHLTIRLRYPDLPQDTDPQILVAPMTGSGHCDDESAVVESAVAGDDDRIIEIEAGGPTWEARLPVLAAAIERWTS